MEFFIPFNGFLIFFYAQRMSISKFGVKTICSIPELVIFIENPTVKSQMRKGCWREQRMLSFIRKRERQWSIQHVVVSR